MEKSAGKGPDVKACAPYHKTGLSSLRKLFDHSSPQGSIKACVKRLIRKDKVDQMMPDSLPILRGWFVRADIHRLIDLHGIGADNFAPPFLCQIKSQSRLPHACRAQDNNESRTVGDTL